MKNSRFILIASIIVMVFSCENPRFNFEKAIIPLNPQNTSALNTEYDDYNADMIERMSGDYFSLAFSSNRYSNGENYDFVFYSCYLEFSLVTGEFGFNAEPEICYFFDTINTTANEYGPYFPFNLIDYTWNFLNDSTNDKDKRFFYASDPDGNLDIYHALYDMYEQQLIPYSRARPLNVLNTEYDEAYLCIHPDEKPGQETVYFTSNRDSSFNIYSASSETGKLISESDTAYVNKMDVLSSNADDKCPYITNNIMVFTSDREGGYGGFDLYYSSFDGDNWSAPKNFGGRINTAYDEYRPVLFDTEDDAFFNDMLIFSSNRPGGKGGYDLYIVGLMPISNYTGNRNK